MARQKKKKSVVAPLLILFVLIGAAAGIAFMRVDADREHPVSKIMELFAPPTPDPALTLADFAPAEPPARPVTAEGQALLQLWEHTRACVSDGGLTVTEDRAEQRLRLTTLDLDRLREDLIAALSAELPQWVDAAASTGEVYDENGLVRDELLRQGFAGQLPILAAQTGYGNEQDFTLRLRYAEDAWSIENRWELDALWLGELADADAAAEAMLREIASALPYVPKHYRIDENVLVAPAPDPARFGESEDPAELAALLQTEEAQRLIAGRQLVWNPDIERFPGSTIHWYLDETILCIVWQEVEAREVGTFSEIIVADGSQLRRRIAVDEPFSFAFATTTDFALDCNAVLCLGGDFYHHGRACGVVVYQRDILRFEPKTCDCCYITPDGDMLFSYRGQFSTEEEARQFIEANDVLFSLCFGPVLIDDGVDVTPDYYNWGEIHDNYARSALGLIDPLHYLTMNLNCGAPGTQYYYLATLRQETDAMLARGCYKAYALDGGQTATTVFNGVRVNPVQFGWEKPISDVIYFATALPEA